MSDQKTEQKHYRQEVVRKYGVDPEWFDRQIAKQRNALATLQAQPAAADWQTPTTYAQRFAEAVALLCREMPPADMVAGWIDRASADHRLQDWACERAPAWAQGIGLLDAAHVMADQPTEGVDHEPAQPAAAGVSDETTSLAEQLKNIANGVRICGVHDRRFVGDRLDEIARAILALRQQAVTSEPGAYESRYAEWRQFYGNRITQWMSADELRRAVSQLMTVDAGSPELLLIHAMHLIDQAAPEWIAGEPANLQAAARDADEWLALIQRLNDAGRWRFSQPDSRAKLDGCRVALSKILCAHAPKAVPMTWPKTRDVGRFGDMSKSAHMRVGLDSDNDVYVSVWDEDGGGSVEFVNPGGGGGGSSRRTREALIALMVAMEADNAERPDKDWWARRNGITAPAGGEG